MVVADADDYGRYYGDGDIVLEQATRPVLRLNLASTDGEHHEGAAGVLSTAANRRPTTLPIPVGPRTSGARPVISPVVPDDVYNSYSMRVSHIC
jgi:hypothetical protein